MKRYIYVVIIIVVIAIAAIGVIFLLKKNPSTSSFFGGGSLPSVGTQGSSNGQSTGSGGAGANTAGSAAGGTSGTITLGQGNTPAQTFGIVSDGPVLDYFVNPQNTIIAIKTDGTVISILNGTSTILSSTTISDIISASFSHDGKKIMVSSGDPQAPQTQIFDIASKTWVSAPKGMQSPQWSPMNDYRIAYLVQTANKGTAVGIINASNLKKAPTTEIVLSATDLSLRWIGQNQLTLSDRPSANSVGSLWMLNLSTGKLTPIEYEVSGLEAIWGNVSATDTIGLLFTEGGGVPSLKMIDLSGVVLHAFSFVTLPSKCVFATTTITSSTGLYLYCGVPQDQNSFTSAQLPDDYNMMGLFTSDQIESVNASSGAIDLLRADTTPHIDVTDMKVFNNILFFVNRYDQKLYALTL